MTIPTPITSEKISETSQIQKKLIRDSIGVNDFPIQTDKTYIVFDADAGNNNLFIDIVAGSKTYSVLKGDGSQPIPYTDTGGTKILNYTNAGRYIITIESIFNGLDLAGSAQVDKDRLISIIGGSNYPTTIIANALKDCHELTGVSFPFVLVTDSNCFDTCSELLDIHFPAMTDIGQQSFQNCVKIEEINLPVADFAFSGGFLGCIGLRTVILPVALNISGNKFDGCTSLENVYAPLATTMSFPNCTSLREIDCSNAGIIAFNGCTKLRTISLKSVVTVGSMSNVILTDVFVNGTEAQAIVIQDDIVTAGGLFTNNSRIIYGSKNLANIVSWEPVADGIAYSGNIVSVNNKKTVTNIVANAGGAVIFPTMFGSSIPQTGMLYVTESGVGKYLIATIFKQNSATTPVVNILSSNVHAIGAVLADGTIPITGFTTSGNVRMKIDIEES